MTKLSAAYELFHSMLADSRVINVEHIRPDRDGRRARVSFECGHSYVWHDASAPIPSLGSVRDCADCVLANWAAAVKKTN